MRIAAFVCIAAAGLTGCPKKLAAPVASKPAEETPSAPRREVGPLVALGLLDDRVPPKDHPIGPDGDKDFAFRVTLSGDVEALVLSSSDVKGNVVGGEVWDTLTGPDAKYPAALGVAADPRATWALAIYDGKGTLLNPQVTLERKQFAGETITIYAADVPHLRFVPGRTYTLRVVRSDGTIDRATTTLL